MIDRIVVAYDGSDLAREAFAYAAMLAGATAPRPGEGSSGSSSGPDSRIGILGLHVLEPPPPIPLAADPMPGMEVCIPLMERPVDEAAERARFERQFEELGAFCRGQGARFASRIVTGELLTTLLREVGPTDLLAIGAKGRFSRAGVGSTTRALVSRSPCPVMVVSGALRPVNRVLAALDGSDVSVRALRLARNLAEQTRWPLTVLAIVQEGVSQEALLDQADTLAPAAGVITLRSGDDSAAARAELIEHAAGRDRFGLLVMGAYRHGWLHDLLFGSATGKVLGEMGAPVILVHAAPAGEQEG